MKRSMGRAIAVLVSIALALVALATTTPAGAATTTHTLWSTSDATKKDTQTQQIPIEVGTRFRSSVDGQVTGITFWKNSADTGQHVGSLWTADGQRLATLTFSGETATGWQRATFARPVTIRPNTEYVVSYHVPTGRHAYSYRYFRDRDVTSGPLFAPRSGGGKVNGVAKQGPAGTFPDGNWEDLNYWVSPMFTEGPAVRDSQAWVNPNSNNCMDVQWAGTADDTTVQTYTCNGTGAQQWAWQRDALVNPASGKCLDVQYGAKSNGARVELYTCNGGWAQKWERRGSTLVNLGSGMCLDVNGQSKDVGVPLQIWQCNGTVAQDWNPVTATRPVPGTGQFEARNGLIYDPQGREFLPIGANVGADHAFDWRGTAYGHAKEAKEWGWNTVRLNVLATDIIGWSFVHQRGYDAFVADVDRVVQEYTAQGIVVMIDSHDVFMVDEAHRADAIAQVDRFWGDMGRRYQKNPYVWFNLDNEPPMENQAWFDLADRHAKAVRDTGAKNPIIVDSPDWGQDLGPQQPWFKDSKFAYEPDMAPALNKKYGNVILSQHNYGGYEMYTTPEKFSAYVDRVRASGLSLVIGEFGYTYTGTTTAGSYAANKAGADAAFAIHKSKKLGVLWWHATHGDDYSLKDDGSAFFAYGSGNRLSEGGKRMWALTH